MDRSRAATLPPSPYAAAQEAFAFDGDRDLPAALAEPTSCSVGLPPSEEGEDNGAKDHDAEDDADPGASPFRPETLHPSLWYGHQLAREAASVVATGFPELDAQLPGGGWPRKALVELLLPQPGIGEIRLVAPSLVATQQRGRLVMLFDPPVALSAVALEQLGFDVPELLVIHTRARVIPGTDSLWALEQALKSGHVGAVLAWLPPRLRPERLRRLQLAAHAHDGPAFVFCETSAAQRPTAAPLRLALKPAEADVLSVRILKRRGPVLEKPIGLALQPVLCDIGRQRAENAGARADVDARDRSPGSLQEATFVDLAFMTGAAGGQRAAVRR